PSLLLSGLVAPWFVCNVLGCRESWGLIPLLASKLTWATTSIYTLSLRDCPSEDSVGEVRGRHCSLDNTPRGRNVPRIH
ncbi:hypothetical protein NPIL_520611, partial [Nephila pilipes]